MTHIEVRKLFKKFFSQHNHTWLKSWPLVPHNDPSLLFVNAGMNQFKNIFLGIESPTHPNVITIQKCLRAGGKHNDLNQIGPSPFHHTFFEMMGNFSFGEYFKEEACRLAWSFLTQELHLPKENLAVSVFKDDKETAEIWNKKINVPKDRIFFFEEEDNFWRMGEQGPCGPCTEIFFDPNAFRSKQNTMFEVWNLVFIQYKENENKKKTLLSQSCIDTGMGLERLLTLLQNKNSNYHTDLFSPILDKASQITGSPYNYIPPEKEEGDTLKKNSALRVLADHTRACVFLLNDGVRPANDGRGYVLRRILRRAIYHGTQLTSKKSFLSEIAPSVIQHFSSVYPELLSQKKIIELQLKQEEEKFFHTLDQGNLRLQEELALLKKKKNSVLSGEICFQLYDTYGFPFDLVELICKRQGIDVQTKVFEQKMKESKLKAKKASRFSSSTYNQYASLSEGFDVQKAGEQFQPDLPHTNFIGYSQLASSSQLKALFDKNNSSVSSLKAPCKALAVFDQTCFYAEGGGQVGDQGSLSSKKSQIQADIVDCQNIQGRYLHVLQLNKGELKTGDKYLLEVSSEHRTQTAIHHSATHLLHSALRHILGKDITKQAGSLVAPDRLRFDFTADKALSEEQLIQVEDSVNKQILKNTEVDISFKDYDKAIEDGALSFFEKPQNNKIRVLQMGDFSMELCGGTHVRNTGDILYLKIIHESSVAAGVRRIEAICGKKALDFVTYLSRENLNARKYFHLPPSLSVSLLEPIEKQKTLIQKLKKSKTLTQQSIPDSVETFEFNSEKFSLHLATDIADDHDALSALADSIKQRFSPVVVILVGNFTEKSAFIVVSFPKNLSKKIPASSVIKHLGGKGGGPPTFAKGVLNQPITIEKLRKDFFDLLQINNS